MDQESSSRLVSQQSGPPDVRAGIDLNWTHRLKILQASLLSPYKILQYLLTLCFLALFLIPSSLNAGFALLASALAAGLLCAIPWIIVPGMMYAGKNQYWHVQHSEGWALAALKFFPGELDEDFSRSRLTMWAAKPERGPAAVSLLKGMLDYCRARDIRTRATIQQWDWELFRTAGFARARPGRETAHL